MIGRAVRLVGHGRSRRRFGFTGWAALVGAFLAWAAWTTGNPDTFRAAFVVLAVAVLSGALRRRRSRRRYR